MNQTVAHSQVASFSLGPRNETTRFVCKCSQPGTYCVWLSRYMCSGYIPACQHEYPGMHLASHMMVTNYCCECDSFISPNSKLSPAKG